jgi:2-C-methyl-D-erythritol 4-phosphate cytidylyltransferase
VYGDPRNLKVTTPDDLVLAAGLAAVWHAGRWTDRS